MGRPGLDLKHGLWERDVVTRHCLMPEQQLAEAGRIVPGVVQDSPLCACEWGFAQPPPLRLVP